MFVGKRRLHTGGGDHVRAQDEHDRDDAGDLPVAEAQGARHGVHEERDAPAADPAVAAVLHGRGRAGRRDGRRDGRPDGHPAVDGVRGPGGPAAAVRPVRLVPGRVRLHVRGQLQGRADGAHGHRVADDVQRAAAAGPGGSGTARARVRHAAVSAHRHHTAGHGRVRPGHNHRLRVRARVLGVHVRRGAADRRVAGQGPVGRARHRVQPVGDGALAVRRRGQREPGRRGHRRWVHRVPAGAARAGRGAHRVRGPGATEPRAAVREQDAVADRLDPELDHRGRVHGHQLRVRARPRRRGRRVLRAAVQDHRPRARGPAAVRRAAVLVAAAGRQRHRGRGGRLPGHGVRDAVQRCRAAAHRAAGEHIHLQVVRARQDGGRDPGAAGHRAVQHRQRVRAQLPGVRVVQPERGEQRERRAHAPGRPVHRGAGRGRAAVLHPVLLLHTQGVPGRGHRHRGRVHGRGARGQAHLPVQEERPHPGAVHVRRVPVPAAGDRRPVRHRAQPRVHPVPRGPAEDLHPRVPDARRAPVPDADAGPVPGVPVRGLRAQPGHQAQPEARHAGGHRLLARVRRRLHGRQGRRDAHQGLRRPRTGALLLQPQAQRGRGVQGRQAQGAGVLLSQEGVGPAVAEDGRAAQHRVGTVAEKINGTRSVRRRFSFKNIIYII